VTESPTRLDQSFPRGRINRTREWQTARALERFDERERALTERLECVVRREMTERCEVLV
jgi:Fe-S oxidoreductase